MLINVLYVVALACCTYQYCVAQPVRSTIAVAKLDIIQQDIKTVEQTLLDNLGRQKFNRLKHEFNIAAITPKADKIKLLDDLGKKIADRITFIKGSKVPQARKEHDINVIYDIIFTANDIIQVINFSSTITKNQPSAIRQFNKSVEQVGARMETVMQNFRQLNYTSPVDQESALYTYYVLLVWQAITQNMYTFIQQRTAPQARPDKPVVVPLQQTRAHIAALDNKLHELARVRARSH